MNAHNQQARTDWLLGGLMFLLCAGLTVLQYRWTGEIANAELNRLRASLEEQTRALARAFDTELSESCRQLRPNAEDFSGPAWQSAQRARFRRWQAGNPRPIFRRIAMAVPAQDEAELFMLHPDTGELGRTNWPSEWEGLLEKCSRKDGGPPRPFNDEAGTLLEFPLMSQEPQPEGPMRGNPERGWRQGPPEKAWLILELDLACIRTAWLPELIARYLNPDAAATVDARVRTMSHSSVILYSSQTNLAAPGAGAVSAQFNLQGKTEHDYPGPSRGGCWLLEAWHRPGALEAIVSASRHRNLAVALALNLLMLATAMALVHHTRRSRRLAEAQLNFVANVSHELRTPLTVIRGAAHNLKRGVVNQRSEIEQYSGLIIRHAEQLTDMIEQLLELAGANKNQPALAPGPVALPEVLKGAIAASEHETQVAGCSVQLDLPAALPAVPGDARALGRVFQNLIVNAAKHASEGGWIGLSAAVCNGQAAPMVEVRVADRGPGIPQSEQAAIFKPFVRGSLAQSRQVRGSGLGLSLVREIVELHHGHVSVTSQPGQGATFTVRLPALATPAVS